VRSGGSILLAKSDGKWRITRHPRTLPTRASCAASCPPYGSLQAVDFVAEEPTELSSFGLDHPRTEIRLLLTSGENATVIRLGADTQDKQVYLQTSSRPTVYTVNDWVLRDLDKEVNDFRDKTVLPFETANVVKIDVNRKAEGSFTLNRTGDGAWALVGAEGAPDRSKIDAFLDDTHELKGYEIASDGPADLADYGLAEPILVITLHDKDGVVGSIRLGSHTPEPPAVEYTALRDGTATVFHVREHLFKRVDKKLADLLQRPTPTATPVTTPASG